MQVASDNIMELAHDVDTLLADKLDAIFKADNFSLEHVAFIKNLVNCDDIKKGSSALFSSHLHVMVRVETVTLC